MAQRAIASILEDLEGPLAGRIRRGSQTVAEGAPDDRLATGFAAWDDLLHGGLQRGALTEIVGRHSCGRFGLVYGLLATVTEPGESAALVDQGDGFDPRQAEAAGTDLRRLLWLRPRSIRESLAAAATALDGGFPLVLIELGLPPLRGGRGNDASWVRLARTATERRSSLVVSSPYRVSGMAARWVLELTRRQGHWLGRGTAPRLLGRLASRLELKKARGRCPGESIRLDLYPAGPREGLPAPPSSRPRELPRPARTAYG